jgi:ankyrin repeat protein
MNLKLAGLLFLALIAKPKSVVCMEDPQIAANRKLMVASIRGDKERALEALAEGADVNSYGNIGMTPLHLAARHNNWDIVQLLIFRGAILDSRTVDGRTPLHLAAAGGYTDIVRLLLFACADCRAQARDHVTPLDLALIARHLNVAKLLELFGATARIRNNGGREHTYIRASFHAQGQTL